MNYYPYGEGGSMQPAGKVGMPGVYASPVTAMGYPQQGGLPPGAATAAAAVAMQPGAQHYTSMGSSSVYPGASVYASSIPGSNPYATVSANPYAHPSPITSAHAQSTAAAAAQAYAGYSASPYAATQGVTPGFRGAMVAPSSRYPSTSYSVGGSGMLGYPPSAAQVRSPSGYPAVGGYPAVIPGGIPGYQSTPGMPGYAAAPHPSGYASVPGYPGGTPYIMSRQIP